MITFYTTDVPHNTLRDVNVALISLKSAPNLLVYSTPFSTAKNINAENEIYQAENPESNNLFGIITFRYQKLLLWLRKVRQLIKYSVHLISTFTPRHVILIRMFIYVCQSWNKYYYYLFRLKIYFVWGINNVPGPSRYCLCNNFKCLIKDTLSTNDARTFICTSHSFLVHDAFVRTNRRATRVLNRCFQSHKMSGLISYSLSSISAKNYLNQLMCIEVIVCYISVIFLEKL